MTSAIYLVCAVDLDCLIGHVPAPTPTVTSAALGVDIMTNINAHDFEEFFFRTSMRPKLEPEPLARSRFCQIQIHSSPHQRIMFSQVEQGSADLPQQGNNAQGKWHRMFDRST